MTRLTKYAVVAVVIAFLAQSLWESPLAKVVYHMTYLGGRAAWGMGLRPGWPFDLLAVAINASLYLLLMLVLDAAVRHLQRQS